MDNFNVVVRQIDGVWEASAIVDGVGRDANGATAGAALLELGYALGSSRVPAEPGDEPKAARTPASAVVTQVGGEHYSANSGLCPSCGGEIQHWDLYATLPYLEGMVAKYVTRWRSKGGIQDLEKARSAIDKLISVTKLRDRQ